MADRTLVLELLDDIKPRRYCDDCLSIELDIKPRQAINQICRALFASSSINRAKAICDRCGKEKITNARSGSHETVRTLRQATRSFEPSPRGAPPIDIEKARTNVVQICRELWQTTQAGASSHSLSANIAALKKAGVLPAHQSNMMHTLCGLRNVHIYEGLVLGNRELTIATNALEIILEWWVKERSAKVARK